jgi:hypothetical protein
MVRPTKVRSGWAPVRSTAVQAARTALWAPLQAAGTAPEAGWLAARTTVPSDAESVAPRFCGDGRLQLESGA